MAYTAIFKLTVKQENWDEFTPQLKENIARSREEEGCIAFDVKASAEKPNELIYIEQYKDRAAFDVHCSSDRVKAHLAKTAHMIEGDVHASYWVDLG